MKHLLVTNDFPPRVGGIQSYLWELWRRLDPASFEVLTTPYAGDSTFDGTQPFTTIRSREPVLLPTPWFRRTVEGRARAMAADLVVVDPALPVGLIGPRLTLPYAVVVHGAELTVPARVPGARSLLGPVLGGARLVVAAGRYPAAEAAGALARVARAGRGRGRADALPEVVSVPPGVDTERFRPLSAAERAEVRTRFDIGADARLVVSMSRLVPRKGMDVLIAAASLLAPERPDLVVAIAGSGRDRDRLERLVAATGAPVRLLGRVPDEDLPRLLGAADVFTMLCRSRWAGLEQEGFGIVFLEAAACGVPQVAGDSGGAAEAVAHGETGWVVRSPDDPAAAAAAIARLLDDAELRARMGENSRARAVEQFSYDSLAHDLGAALGRAMQPA